LKTEYEPLFDPGFHNITLEDIDEIFVLDFNDSSKRQYLTKRFKVLVSLLEEIGAEFEIWIDGSFSTKKPEPNDIDIAIVGDSQTLNSLPIEKQKILADLIENKAETKLRYSCDIYFVPKEESITKSYWRGWFGFTRNEKPKGIPRLFLEAGNN